MSIRTIAWLEENHQIIKFLNFEKKIFNLKKKNLKKSTHQILRSNLYSKGLCTG